MRRDYLNRRTHNTKFYQFYPKHPSVQSYIPKMPASPCKNNCMRPHTCLFGFDVRCPHTQNMLDGWSAELNSFKVEEEPVAKKETPKRSSVRKRSADSSSSGKVAKRVKFTPSLVSVYEFEDSEEEDRPLSLPSSAYPEPVYETPKHGFNVIDTPRVVNRQPMKFAPARRKPSCARRLDLSGPRSCKMTFSSKKKDPKS